MKPIRSHFLCQAVAILSAWFACSSASAAVFSFQGTIEQVPGVPTFPDHTLDYFEFCVDTPGTVTLNASWITGFGGSAFGIRMGIFATTEASLIPGGIPDSGASVRPNRLNDMSANLLGAGRFYGIVWWEESEWDGYEGIQPFFVSEAFGSGTYRIELEGDITMKRILEGQGDGTFRVTNLIPEPSALVLGLVGAAVFLSRRRRVQ